MRLDDFIYDNNILPNFIKIDVEGFEFEVIKGMSYILKSIQPIFMIEVLYNRNSIYNVMKNENYLMFNDNLKLIKNPDEFSLNAFFLHSKKHISILNTLGVDIS